MMITVEAPTTLEVVPTADAYVDSASASANFGASSILSVNSARTTYLRFTVNGIGTRQVVRAALRLQVDGSSAAASPAGGTVHTISNGTWGERTITAKSRPLVDGPAFGSVGAVKPGQVVEFDLTGAVTCARLSSSSLRVGTHTITAAATDSNGHPGQARITVRVRGPNAAPAVSITAPADGASAPAGTPVILAATATDDFDPDPSASIRRSSTPDGHLGP